MRPSAHVPPSKHASRGHSYSCTCSVDTPSQYRTRTRGIRDIRGIRDRSTAYCIARAKAAHAVLMPHVPRNKIIETAQFQYNLYEEGGFLDLISGCSASRIGDGGPGPGCFVVLTSASPTLVAT
eukprot:2789766-Rhodomonas_salina.5